LRDSQRVVLAQQLVDETHAAHVEQAPLGFGQRRQCRVERARPEQEPGVHDGTAAQFERQAFLGEPGAGARVAEIGLDAHAVRRHDAAVFEAAFAAQHARRTQLGDVARTEHRAGARGQQAIEQRGVDARAGTVRRQRTLQR
jgi:hypothetical protein